jgi:hypothetical protein
MNATPFERFLRDKDLASLGDAFVNFIYSLALTEINGRPHGTKVSDRVLSDAFRLAGLREALGTRVSRKDLANAAEALLARGYQQQLITIDESVSILSENPDGPQGGLSNLLKLTAQRVIKSS